MSMSGPFSFADLAVTIERVGGRVRTPLLPTTRLEELGLDPALVYLVVADLEHVFNIDFPEGLIESLTTADDVTYAVNIKLDQKASELNRGWPFNEQV